MKKTPKAWTKYHLINAVNNCATEPPAKGEEDGRRTVAEISEWAFKLWDKPDSGVSKHDVYDMMDHLLKTGQVVFVANIKYLDPSNIGTGYSDLFVKLGDVIFEKDIEGYHVHEAAERVARQILENLDDRRNSPSKAWADDVREEAVNTWAALIDEGIGYEILGAVNDPQPQTQA